jgi:CDP-diacylglycerol--glycerol-3-phosphate 3-phosphatidyltransferase
MNVIPQVVRDGVLRGIDPLAQGLIRAQISPNLVSTLGAFIVLGAAAAFASGRPHWGGALVLLNGLFDLLDGQVARDGGRASAFGAFYDSTLDRVGEMALFGGIAWWFVTGGVPAARAPIAMVMAITALGASVLVSYTRARAEGLGYECKVGIAQRAERVLLLGAPTLFFGAGRDGALLFWIIVILAAATTVTVAQRVLHVARLAAGRNDTMERAAVRRNTLAGHAPAFRKGH